MKRPAALLLAACMIFGCSDRSDTPRPATEESPADSTLPDGFTPAPLPQEGTFALQSLDGRVGADFRMGGDARLAIEAQRMWLSACNSIPFALARFKGGFSAVAGPQTLVACMDGPDDALKSLLEAKVAVGMDEDGRLALVSPEHTAIFTSAPEEVMASAGLDVAPPSLAETEWRNVWISGGGANPRDANYKLAFDRSRLSLTLECPDIVNAAYRQIGNTVTVSDVRRSPCPADIDGRADRFATILENGRLGIGLGLGVTEDGRPLDLLLANRAGRVQLMR